MAHKLNIALVKNCPPLLTAKVALETLGRPSDKDYGVLHVGDIIEGRVEFEVYRTKHVKLQQVEKKEGSVQTPEFPKDEVWKAALRIGDVAQGIGVLEVFTGSAKSHETIGEFLSSLEFADANPVVEPIIHDIYSKVVDLRDDETTKSFQVLSAKVKGYKDHGDEKITGTYTVRFPKELETANAVAFLADHKAELESVRVKVRSGQTSRPATITIRSSAFYGINCNEADETKAKNICRRLAGTLAKLAGSPAQSQSQTDKINDGAGDE